MIRNVNSDMNMIEYIAYTPTPEINCFFIVDVFHNMCVTAAVAFLNTMSYNN